MSASEYQGEYSVCQFFANGDHEYVCRYRAKPEPIDNSRLPAGSPMYFYCKACGTYITSLPENYLTTPPRYCEACEDLKKVALLDEALRRANEQNENA